MTENRLFYGDNLGFLRRMNAESVDLIYLDPPFNSKRNYNVLYKDEAGKFSESQITAFDDTWHWDTKAIEAYHDLTTQSSPQVSSVIGALHDFIRENQMMAYLVMMAVRLEHLQRVLKPTGSIYLHCDSVASHYLKLVMDAIFGVKNFRNEIIWYYGGRGAKAIGGQFPRNHDVILLYSKHPGKIIYNRQYIERLFTPNEAKKRNYRQDENGQWFKTSPRGDYTDVSISDLRSQGRIHDTKSGGIRIKYPLDLEDGMIRDDAMVGDVWTDIPDAMHIGHEFLGYPTQKPLKLLERIILTGSNPGQVVLDPFCGCGTAIAAAQKRGRKWIGIDVTHLSISLLRHRLDQLFPGIIYEKEGEPDDLSGARQLAQDSPYQFQWWMVAELGGQPFGAATGSTKGKKGSDKGIDGVIPFIDDSSLKPKRTLVQVKSGGVNSRDIRDLVGTVEREKAAMGVFVTLQKPTRDMLVEAASAGLYHAPLWDRNYRKIQVLSVEDHFAGKKIDHPPSKLPQFQTGRASIMEQAGFGEGAESQ
jgi:site-specific DNA-methyltransferase (adenine-specific)